MSKAHIIVTDNVRHFPDEALSSFNLEAYSADTFLTYGSRKLIIELEVESAWMSPTST
ncbi:MAG TPA: hypothetical protein VLA19_28490 [Herpetosiphonaceae bacterium]|nr:hypothetical protein [Herpetosiphonaceae bacterium]